MKEGKGEQVCPNTHQKTAPTRVYWPSTGLPMEYMHLEGVNSSMVSLTQTPHAKVRGHRIKAKSTRHTGISILWLTPAATAIHKIGHHFQEHLPPQTFPPLGTCGKNASVELWLFSKYTHKECGWRLQVRPPGLFTLYTAVSILLSTVWSLKKPMVPRSKTGINKPDRFPSTFYLSWVLSRYLR